MNRIVPSRALLATRSWWVAAAIVAVAIFAATLLSFLTALTALEVSPILLTPGVGAALLARLGRSLWPAVLVGDAVGQVVMHDRAGVVVAGSLVIQVVACLLCATWLHRAGCWLRDLGQAVRFAGIAVAVSAVGGVATGAMLAVLHGVPAGYGVADLTGWATMGYMAGFLVGGAFILAWGDPAKPMRGAFQQPVAMTAFAAVAAIAGIGLIMEVGPLVPLALAGALAIAGRSGARWGTATVLAITILVIVAAEHGMEAPFGGQNPAQHAANAMLAISLFGGAVIALAGYREGGEDRERSPVAVAITFGVLMLVAGITALAANEVALNEDTPYVLSGLLSLGAAIGLGLLRISRTPAMRSTSRGIVLALVAGAVYVLNLALYLQAVPLVGSGPATGLTMTAPLWIVLLGMIVYRTRPSLGIIAAVALIIAGAMAIASGSMGSPLGITLALASAGVFAVSVIVTKQALAHANVIDVSLAAASSAAVVALVVGGVTEGASAFDLTAAEYGALAMAALGAQLVPTLGRSWALSLISADVVGAEGVLAPVTTTLLSFWFLDAVTSGADVVGLVVIAAGAVVAALLGSRRPAADTAGAEPG